MEDETQFVPDYDETEEVSMEDPGVMGAGNASGQMEASVANCGPWKKGQTCPLCRKNLKSHVIRVHLTWYLARLTVCWACEAQEGKLCFLLAKHQLSEMHPSPTGDDRHLIQWVLLANGCLYFLAYKFNLRTIPELFHYLCARFHPPPVSSNSPDFTAKETVILHAYQTLNRLPCTPVPSIHPPNSIACLLHWRVLTFALSLLSSGDVQEFKSLRDFAPSVAGSRRPWYMLCTVLTVRSEPLGALSTSNFLYVEY